MQRRSHAFKAFISMLFAGFVYVIYTLSKATDSANQKPNGKDLRGSIVRKFDLLSVSNRKAIDDPIDLLITFTKANHNNEIQDKFRTCVSSLFKFLSVPIRLNLMSDNASRDIANHILHPWTESSQLITVSIKAPNTVFTYLTYWRKRQTSDLNISASKTTTLVVGEASAVLHETGTTTRKVTVKSLRYIPLQDLLNYILIIVSLIIN